MRSLYVVFETKDDSRIFIGIVTDALWQKFCRLLALDGLWAGESLRENNAHVLARDRLLPPIRELARIHSRQGLIDRLEHSGIPFAPIARPEDMFDDPHLSQSGALEPTRLTDGRRTDLPALPITMDGQRVARTAHLPQAGADTLPLLQSLGYSQTEVEELRAAQVVQYPSPQPP